MDGLTPDEHQIVSAAQRTLKDMGRPDADCYFTNDTGRHLGWLLHFSLPHGGHYTYGCWGGDFASLAEFMGRLFDLNKEEALALLQLNYLTEG